MSIKNDLQKHKNAHIAYVNKSNTYGEINIHQKKIHTQTHEDQLVITRRCTNEEYEDYQNKIRFRDRLNKVE